MTGYGNIREEDAVLETDVLILGSGFSGSVAALALARLGVEVVLASAGPPEETSYSYQCAETLALDPQNLRREGRYSRAIEQIEELAPEFIEEIIQKDLLLDPEQECFGQEAIAALQTRLKEAPIVTYYANWPAVELLTLEKHSEKETDIFLKPACLGAHLYDPEKGAVVPVLAKETILATGGIGRLFKDGAPQRFAAGSGIAMAHQAGARVINLPGDAKMQTAGGVAVDRNGQTAVQRLRAIGRTACTGAHGRSYSPEISMVESLVWAMTASRDIAKRIHKYVYYFPKLRPYVPQEEAPSPELIAQDIEALQQTMNHYCSRDPHKYKRTVSSIHALRQNAEETYRDAKLNTSLIQLQHSLYAADLLTTKSAP